MSTPLNLSHLSSELDLNASPSHPQSSGNPGQGGFSGATVLARILEGGDVGNHLNEFLSLSRETDPELFYEGLYNLGVRLEQSGQVGVAARVYSTLSMARPLTPAPLPGGERAIPSNIQQQAQARLAALRGEGSVGLRLEVLGRSFARQAMAPAPLIGMGVAGLAFRGMNLFAATRLANLSAGFWTRGPGLRVLSGLAGFAAEVPAFTLTTRWLESLVGAGLALPEAHRGAPILQELASATLVLGSLKLFGAAFGRAGQALPLPGTRHAVPIQGVLQQAGMLTGIMAGHGLEVAFGLRERQNASNFLVESLVTLAQFNVAGRLSNSVFGERYERLQRSLAMQAAAVGAGSTRPSWQGNRGTILPPTVAEGRWTLPLRGSAERVRQFIEQMRDRLNGPSLAGATVGGGRISEESHSSTSALRHSDTFHNGRLYSMSIEGGEGNGGGLGKNNEIPPPASGRVQDVTPVRRSLVVTGGSSGIGEQLVLQAAARGYQILFGGTRVFSDLGAELQKLGIHNYLQMDVRDPAAVSTLRDIAMGRHDEAPSPMLVVASAGISARGSEAEIENMRAINIGGTRSLLKAFLHSLAGSRQNRFVGVGSIVAAEGIPLRGDEAYQQTKREIHEDILALGRDVGEGRNIPGFTLVPGAVDTPMTRQERVFGFLMNGLVRDGIRLESPFRPGLLSLLGGEVPGTPAELLSRLLPTLAANHPRLIKPLGRDPQIASERTQLLLADALTQDKVLQDDVVRILRGLDVVVTPEWVALQTLEQFESGEIPPGRMLKVYSHEGQDLILRLLGAASEGPPPAPAEPAPPTVRQEPTESLRRHAIPPPSTAVDAHPTSVTGLTSKGVQRVSDSEWRMDVTVTPREARVYSMATGNTALALRDIVPTGMSFAKAFPLTVAATEEARLRARPLEKISMPPMPDGQEGPPKSVPAPDAPLPAVLHITETTTYHRPIREDEPFQIRLSREVKGREGKRQVVYLRREMVSHEGEVLERGESILFVGGDKRQADVVRGPRPQGVPPTLQVEITPDLIDAFSEGSGDYNPVHTSDAAAQELGLPGRILHGMATFNLAERALYQARHALGPDRLETFKTSFKGMARPGDVLSFFVDRTPQGDKVTVLNQRDEVVLTLETQPAPMVPREVSTIEAGEMQKATRTYGETEVEVDVGAGYATVRRALDRMAKHLPRLREIMGGRPDQPWFVAGISDGMGLHSTLALMASGVRNLVGGFFEPEALLRVGSEIHLGRLANVEGLRVYAEQLGIHFDGIYQDLVLPEWKKGKINVKPLPNNVRVAIEAAQRRSWNPDLNFINSIAFARWICPSPGVEQRKGVPSLDTEGQVVLMDMKPYQEKGYQGTLDSMGRNHGALLEALHPYFGSNSTSFFFTWAGGSQNMHILKGVYGGGVLGDAKEIGEIAAVRSHLASQDRGFEQGHHKIIRFPDFPSFAIFGIPGGGGMAMIARHVLEGHGRFMDVGDLAPLAYIHAFGGEHNLRNPVAQIELDIPESYHLAEISENLGEFHRRVDKYRAEHPEWDGKPLPLEVSRELLLNPPIPQEVIDRVRWEYQQENPERDGEMNPALQARILSLRNLTPFRPLVSEDYVAKIPKATE